MTSKAKQLEEVAFNLLVPYILERFPGAVLENHCNKGSGNSEVIGDAIMRYEGRVYDIEIKASTKAPNSNVRIAHQTVTKARGKDVIVALVSMLGTDKATFEFFRLTDVVNELIVEPHFLIRKKQASSKMQPLASLLALPDGALNIEAHLDRSVRSFLKKRVHDVFPNSVALAADESKDLVEQADEEDVDLIEAETLSNPELPLKAATVGGAPVGSGAAAPTPPPWASPDHQMWSPYDSNVNDAGEPYPPWLKYPNLPITSMGWRMGEGEDYNMEFSNWLDRQPLEVLRDYSARFPAPAEWGQVWPKRLTAR